MLFHLFLNTNCKWEPFPSLQPTCPLLFAFLKFLLKMASKKPKSPPKLRLSGHPVRNSVFVTIGNCKRPQIWILLICYILVSSETCNCNVRIVITYYIDFSIKRFYRLLRINLLFVQTKQQVSISLLSKIMDFLKVLIESIYCCEEWTMIKNLRIVSRVFLYLTIISAEKSDTCKGKIFGL